MSVSEVPPDCRSFQATYKLSDAAIRNKTAESSAISFLRVVEIILPPPPLILRIFTGFACFLAGFFTCFFIGLTRFTRSHSFGTQWHTLEYVGVRATVPKREENGQIVELSPIAKSHSTENGDGFHSEVQELR